MVLGDHQPARLRLGATRSAATCRSTSSARPETLARLDGWGWTPGLIPAADAPVWRMEAFRDRFLAAFGTAPAAPRVQAAAAP